MTDTNRSTELRAELLVLTVVVIWASNFPIAKWGLEGLGVFLFNAVRYGVAAGLLTVLYFARSSWQPIQREDRMKLLGLGLLAGVCYQLAFIFGLNLTSAGNSAVILSTSPLWTIIFHARIHKEGIKRSVFLGMLLSVAGVALITIGSGKKFELGSGAMVGDLVTFGAAALWGLNTVLQKPLLARYSPLQLTLVVIVIGAIGLTAMAIPDISARDIGGIEGSYVVAGVISGALSIAFANVLWSHGVKRLGPARTSAIGNLVPVLALVISYFVLHERLVPVQVVGVCVTLAGVWLARK